MKRTSLSIHYKDKNVHEGLVIHESNNVHEKKNSMTKMFVEKKILKNAEKFIKEKMLIKHLF